MMKVAVEMYVPQKMIPFVFGDRLIFSSGTIIKTKLPLELNG